MVSKLSVQRPTRQVSDASIVHTTTWDIEMHNYLTAASRKGMPAIHPPRG